MIDATLEWVNVVGRVYVNLLKVIVTPLVLSLFEVSQGES